MKRIVFEEGATILEKGAENDYFFVIESGALTSNCVSSHLTSPWAPDRIFASTGRHGSGGE